MSDQRCECGLRVVYAAPEQHDPKCPVAMLYKLAAEKETPDGPPSK